MTIDVPDQTLAAARRTEPVIGMAALTARRRRGAYRLAITARCAVGSNRGRIHDPA